MRDSGSDFHQWGKMLGHQDGSIRAEVSSGRAAVGCLQGLSTHPCRAAGTGGDELSEVFPGPGLYEQRSVDAP